MPHLLKPSFTALLISISLGNPAAANIIAPDDFQVKVPDNSNSDVAGNHPSTAYRDDVLLDAITFGDVTFTNSDGNFSAGLSVYVAEGRPYVNAERGDVDDNSDGNPDPFTRVGLDPNNYESTDPAYQDAALASAFSSLSLTEGTDGEGRRSVFRIVFDAGIADDSAAVDGVPEILLFERGNNDHSTIRAITGGSIQNPTYAPNAVKIAPRDMWASGVFINTHEIGGGQELGIAAYDLNTFGTSNKVFGIEIDTRGGDFYGLFSAATPIAQYTPTVIDHNNTVVPEPSSFALWIGLGTALTVGFKRRLIGEGTHG